MKALTSWKKLLEQWIIVATDFIIIAGKVEKVERIEKRYTNSISNLSDYKNLKMYNKDVNYIKV